MFSIAARTSISFRCMWTKKWKWSTQVEFLLQITHRAFSKKKSKMCNYIQTIYIFHKSRWWWSNIIPLRCNIHLGHRHFWNTSSDVISSFFSLACRSPTDTTLVSFDRKLNLRGIIPFHTCLLRNVMFQVIQSTVLHFSESRCSL